MSQEVVNQLNRLLDELIDKYQQQFQRNPLVEQEQDWPSPCEMKGTEQDGQIQWQPIKRETLGYFDDLEKALPINFHPDLKTFYGGFFANNITAIAEQGECELLQAWSDDDFERLLQNITGHVLMKRKLKQEDTVFIGVTDEEDLLISIDNASGEVWLEYVGKKPHLKLADSIAEFLTQLSARTVE